jgi:hypothetical protein
MNTLKTSALRTVLEYLGRGATPVDGYQWVEPPKASAPKHGTPEARRVDRPRNLLMPVRLG